MSGTDYRWSSLPERSEETTLVAFRDGGASALSSLALSYALTDGPNGSFPPSGFVALNSAGQASSLSAAHDLDHWYLSSIRLLRRPPDLDTSTVQPWRLILEWERQPQEARH